MMKLKKIEMIVLSAICLAGCAGSGKVEKGFDPLFKKNICRVHLSRMASGYGKTGELSVERDGNDIKTLLITSDYSSFLLKDGTFHNPKVAFEITEGDQVMERFELPGKTVDVKRWTEPVYGGLIVTYVNVSKATATLPLTVTQLRNLMKSKDFTVKITDSKTTMNGTVGTTEIDLLKQFDKECLGEMTTKEAS